MAIAIPVAVFFSAVYAWRNTTPRGPLPDANAWPEPIRELNAALQPIGIEPGGLEVYLVDGQPGSDLSTVICRLSDTDQRFDLLAQMLDLLPVEPDDRWNRLTTEIKHQAPTDWWPDPTKPTQLFASRRLVEGEEGPLYFVARDSQQNRIYVRYHFNF